MPQTKAEVAAAPPPLKKRVITNNAIGAGIIPDLAASATNLVQTQKNNNKRAIAVIANNSYGNKKRSIGKQCYSRRSFKHKKIHGEPSELGNDWQDILNKQYAHNHYPTSVDYDRLAIETGMERRLVPRWFIKMRKGGMSKTYNDVGARTSTSSPRRSKTNHSILKVEGDLEKEF